MSDDKATMALLAEIDRLRAQIAAAHAAYCHSQQQFTDAAAEIDRLRAQMRAAGALLWAAERVVIADRAQTLDTPMIETLSHACTEFRAAIDRARKSGDGGQG